MPTTALWSDSTKFVTLVIYLVDLSTKVPLLRTCKFMPYFEHYIRMYSTRDLNHVAKGSGL